MLFRSIEAFNRGPEAAPLHVLPHLWFRNRWSWGPMPLSEPTICVGPTGPGTISLFADDSTGVPLEGLPSPYCLGPRYLHGEASGTPLFTNNETTRERVVGRSARSRSTYVKDAFHRHVMGW